MVRDLHASRKSVLYMDVRHPQKVHKETFCNKFNSNLTLNKGSQRQIIKQVGKKFPDISISIFSQTFIVEAIPENM